MSTGQHPFLSYMTVTGFDGTAGLNQLMARR